MLQLLRREACAWPRTLAEERRQVVEQRTEAGSDGGPDREVWLVLPRGSEGAPVRVENPRLKDSDVQEIADQLGEVLQGNW